MSEAQYSDHFGGWVAVKCGVLVRSRDGRVKVFASQEEAMKAAERSKVTQPR